MGGETTNEMYFISSVDEIKVIFTPKYAIFVLLCIKFIEEEKQILHFVV